MSNYRTLTSGLSLGDAYRLAEKQAAEEQARQQQRAARQAEEQRVLDAAKAQVDAQRRMQEDMLRTRDVVAQRAKEAGGFEGIVLQPTYAGATGVVDGLGQPGKLATWAGEQALAHAEALAGSGDPEGNYRDLVAYREMVQRKHPNMTKAGELVGSYAKQQVPPWAGLAADTIAGGTLRGIQDGFTFQNVTEGAQDALAEAALGFGIGKQAERTAEGWGLDLSSPKGKFAKDLFGMAGDKLGEGAMNLLNGGDGNAPPRHVQEAWARPEPPVGSAMDAELARRVETPVFGGRKPKGLAEFESRSRRGGR